MVFTCLQYKFFENTAGKGEIARNEQFLLFPQCFPAIWRTFYHFHQIWNCRLQTLSVWKCLKCVAWERVNILTSYTLLKSFTKQLHFRLIQFQRCWDVNPFPNNDTFWRLWEKSLLEALWEEEKLLVQAISPFPTMFSTLPKTEIIIFVIFNLSSANAFNLVWSKILLCGNGLNGVLLGYILTLSSIHSF